jgi:hypothetical protein
VSASTRLEAVLREVRLAAEIVPRVKVRRAPGWTFCVGLLLMAAGFWPLAPIRAAAQGGDEPSMPPRGPADIMNRSNSAAAKPKLVGEPGASSAGDSNDEDENDQAGAAPSEAAAPVGEDPHAHAAGAPPLERRPLATAEPSATYPAGTVHVRVVDGHDRPVPAADVQLGTMSQEAGRTALSAQTSATGTHDYEKLATGDKQAYRVNVLYHGAKYSSTPFRLPTDRGYDVLIRRLETTSDAKEVVLYIGATSLELKDERIKVVHQVRLINIGEKTYVFPADGLKLPMPKDAVAFQTQEIMTDQHLRGEAGKDAVLTGSIPPGEATLTWGFDVPNSATSFELNFDLPWVTFAYRALADAPPGTRLEVDGLPPAELHDESGRRFWATEIVKRVGDAPLRHLHMRLTGIPGPGPSRYIAVVLALILLGGGVALARKPTIRIGPSPAESLAAQQQQLLTRARALEAERARGEIGPEFHAESRRELEEELAAVLYEQARLSSQEQPSVS